MPARFLFLSLSISLFIASCDSSTESELDDQLSSCEIPSEQIFQGCDGGADCIPSLSNPLFVEADRVDYLTDEDRVLGLRIGEQAFAIPHNILWWHEIVNLNEGNEQLAVTYCPLTGSTIAFDRKPLGGVEFGVSGLLYKTNLIMYDRKNPRSLWPQMSLSSKCGDATGTQLNTSDVFEMTWGGWKDLHPGTVVIAGETGHSRDYTRYPYSDYERTDNSDILFPFGILDDRRSPKERVLGIRSSSRSYVFPFLELAKSGSNRAIEIEVDGNNLAIFWDDDKQAAIAFNTFVEGVIAHFEVVDGKFVDTATGSIWSVDGRAIEGPLTGSIMEQMPNSYVAFWFAWAAFHEEVTLWEAS